MSESEGEFVDRDIHELSQDEEEARPRKRRDTLHNITSRVADDEWVPIAGEPPFFCLIHFR
jgi:hypothetical protein